jgi:hypothetical protein
MDEFCKKYDCNFLSTREQLDIKPTNFDIESSCGHVSTTTFNKLIKYKIGSNEYWMCEYKFYYETINEEDNKEKLING